MFDTLHALDTQTDSGLVTGTDYETDFAETERRTPLVQRELGKIQSKLLTAWAFGMSLGSTVENRSRLLKHTLYCVLRFAALLHLIPSSVGHTGTKSTSVSTRLLHLLKALLSFLPWDCAYSDGPRCLQLVVELSKRLIRLLLTPHSETHQTGHCQISSQGLSTVLLVLQQVSDSLDHTYSLKQRTVWSSAEKKPLQLWPSDVHQVPLLQDEKEEKSSLVHQAQPVPQRPSSRYRPSLWLFTCQCLWANSQLFVDDFLFLPDCSEYGNGSTRSPSSIWRNWKALKAVMAGRRNSSRYLSSCPRSKQLCRLQEKG